MLSQNKHQHIRGQGEDSLVRQDDHTPMPSLSSSPPPNPGRKFEPMRYLIRFEESDLCV